MAAGRFTHIHWGPRRSVSVLRDSCRSVLEISEGDEYKKDSVPSSCLFLLAVRRGGRWFGSGSWRWLPAAWEFLQLCPLKLRGMCFYSTHPPRTRWRWWCGSQRSTPRGAFLLDERLYVTGKHVFSIDDWLKQLSISSGSTQQRFAFQVRTDEKIWFYGLCAHLFRQIENKNFGKQLSHKNDNISVYKRSWRPVLFTETNYRQLENQKLNYFIFIIASFVVTIIRN